MGGYIRWLEEIGAGDLAIVGGKGANLGELVAAGVPVPAAFCVTTDAYRALLDEHGLQGRIADLLDGLDHKDAGAVDRVAEEIRAVLLDSATPAVVEREILDAYAALEKRLGAGVAVSVRSSATAEDLPGASFAGQQDTYLHISGPVALADAVRRCWASLWTGRAIAYRHHQGFDHDTVLLAVVVQEMFPSEVAGVLFTANPVTANPFQLFLNASWGLGEAVVSGQVNPDQLIVDKTDLQIVDRIIPDKLMMTVPVPDGQGTDTVAVPVELQAVPCLGDDDVRELCRIALRIEEHYGYYQDIEWGFADGRFAILQAREITGADLDLGHELETWKTPAALASMYDERWVWSRAYSDEFQTGPSTPAFYTYVEFGMSVLKMLTLMLTATPNVLGYEASEFLDIPYYRWHGARAYFNLAFERERIRLFTPPFARTEAMLLPFPKEERDELRNLPFDWDQFFGMLQMLEDTNPEVSLTGTTAVMYEGMERWVAAEETFWSSFDLETASVDDIVQQEMTIHGESKFYPNVVLPFTIYLYILTPALEALCRAWFDDDGTICTSLIGGIQSKTTEENVALWDLSRIVVRSPELRAVVGATTDGQLRGVLSQTRCGRRLPRPSSTPSSRRTATGGSGAGLRTTCAGETTPALVFQSLRLMVDLDEEQSPARHAERLRPKCRRRRRAASSSYATNRTTSASSSGWPASTRLTGRPRASRADMFEWFVEHVQDWYYYRDFERFHNDKNMARNRSHLDGDRSEVRGRGPRARRGGPVLPRPGGDAGCRPRASSPLPRCRPGCGSAGRSTRSTPVRSPPKYLRGWERFDDDTIDARERWWGSVPAAGWSPARRGCAAPSPRSARSSRATSS